MKMLRSVLAALLMSLVAVGVLRAADSSSALIQLLLMETGLHNNDWGTQLNNNFNKIDSAIAGYTTLATTGGATSPTSDESRYASFKTTGALTSNATITFPATARSFNITNGNTGSFTTTIKCSGGGSGVSIGQGSSYRLYCDGANMVNVAAAADVVPIGAMMPYAGSTAPDSNYALCDGAAVSRTTYATLFARLSTTYGVGDGSTTFNLPDTRGRVLAGIDTVSNRIGGLAAGATGGVKETALAQANLPNVNFGITDTGHTHTASQVAHTHDYTIPSGTTAAAGINATVALVGSATATTSAQPAITVNSSSTGIAVSSGGSATAFTNLQPTLVSNCIIRIQ